LANLWGDDHSYGIAIKQRTEDLKQVLQEDKKEQAKLNTCQNNEGKPCDELIESKGNS